MALSFTVNRAPVAPDLKEACGLPWACVVQPFAPLPSPEGQEEVAAADISRCHECYAYICRQCLFQRAGWACALCGTLNEYSTLHNQRYLSAEHRSTFAELRGDTVEAACNLLGDEEYEEEGDEAGSSGHSGALWEVDAQPVYVALVDAAASPEFLEGVRSALLAALEALPPEALFGLVTVAEQVGLHEALDTGPTVRYVPVLPSGPEPTSVELQDALPLSALLAPVGTAKAAIAAMLEAMAPHPPSMEALPASPGAAEGAAGRAPTRRALGSAVQAVMRYLGSAAAEQRAPGAEQGQRPANGSHTQQQQQQQQQGVRMRAAYTAARLMVFLSGPPTYGRGSVVVPAKPRVAQPAQARELHPLLLDPVYPELSAWTISESPPKAQQQAQQQQQQQQQQGQAQAPAAVDEGSSGDHVIDLSHAAREGSEESKAQLAINWEAGSFYEEAGIAAAALGVCVDLYALCPRFVGLELLRPLAARSGGTMRLYGSPEDAPLPQDVYKRLCTPHAFGCLLRLRASPELRVAPRCHGNAHPDPHYPDLFRIPACGPADTFALDLRHASHEGLAQLGAGTPVVQLVFQYSVLARQGAGGAAAAAAVEEGKKGGPGHRRYVLRRRLRIATISLGVATTPVQLYTSCDAPATALVLMHKVLGAAAAEGSLTAARALLQEWLAALAASASAVLASDEAARQTDGAGEEQLEGRALLQEPLAEGEEPVEGRQVDASFASLEALQPLPRLVYGLLASPLLRGAQPGHHPDAACATTALWAALPPAELASAIYPQLSSWAGPDEVAFPRHSLSRAAVQLSGQPLYLLDAWSQLVVYYDPAATEGREMPFPPPQGTELRQAVNAMRAGRAVMPRLAWVQEGTGDTSAFWQWMLEDGQPDQPDLPPFLEFLRLVESEAAEML